MLEASTGGGVAILRLVRRLESSNSMRGMEGKEALC